MSKLFAPFAALILGSTLASAQPAPNCGPSNIIRYNLGAIYGEELKSRGIVNDSRALLEIWSNGNTGLFTIIVLMPNGTSCIVTTGVSYEIISE